MKVRIRILTVSILTFTFFNVSYTQSKESLDSCNVVITKLFEQGDSLYNLGNKEEENALILWSAEEISRNCQSWDNQVRSLLVLSTLYNEIGDNVNYLLVVDSSLNVAKSKLDSNHIYLAFIYEKLVNAERKKRNYTRSIEFAQKGIGINRNRSSELDVILNNRIADNYFSLGNYSEALDYIENSENIIDVKKINQFYIYDTYGTGAYIHKKLGSISKAIKYYERAEKVLLNRNSNSDHNELLNLWLTLAKYHFQEGDEVLGNRYMNKIEACDFKRNSLFSGGLYHTIALKKYLKGNYRIDELIELINLSNEHYSQSNTTSSSLDVKESENYEFIGDLLSESMRIEEANEYYSIGIEKLGYKSSLDSPDLISNKAQVISMLFKIYKNNVQLNNKDEISKNEEYLLRIIKFLTIENSDASIKEFWANENQNIIEELIKDNFDNSKYSNVYNLIEENKSNLLVQSINENESTGFADLDKSVIETGKSLRKELSYLNSLIHSLENQQRIDTQTIRKWKQERYTVQLKEDQYLSALEKDFPEYYKMKYNIEFTELHSVQSLLDSKTLLVEFFIGKNKAFVAFVGQSNLEIFELEDLESLRNINLNFYKSISDYKFKDTLSSSKKLFDQLKFSKVETISPNIENLIIIPDDFLNNISFGSIVDIHGNFLIEKYNIRYQYSARLWQMLMSRKSKSKKSDFVGYAYNDKNSEIVSHRSCIDLSPSNLKCAGKEVRKVMDVIGLGRSINIEGNLSELLAEARNTKILHLATHACLDEENSDYSRIYFNDTLLTNQDLKNKDLSAELVVLSACETGFGEIIKGEGSMSLSKGFFHAGAKSTVVSLWPVDDCATSELMQYFYKNLKAGQTKDGALRQAKLEYRESVSADKAHPYYWAGFIVIGDCSPIWDNSSSAIYLIAIGVALFLFFLLIGSRLRVKK